MKKSQFASIPDLPAWALSREEFGLDATLSRKVWTRLQGLKQAQGGAASSMLLPQGNPSRAAAAAEPGERPR